MAKRRNKNKAKRGLKGRASNTQIRGVSKDAKLCADDIGADGYEMAPATENEGDGVLVTETENTRSGATEKHKITSKVNNMKRKKRLKHKKVLSDKTGLNAVVNTINSEKEEMASDDNLIFPKEVDGDVCLDVECGSNEAVMVLSKLCLGSKGACIEYKGSWLTPNEFQLVSGRETAKDWKRSIRHNGKSLKLLITKGLIKINATCPEQSKDALSDSVDDRLEQECSSPKQSDEETVIGDTELDTELDGDVNAQDGDDVNGRVETETKTSTDTEQTTPAEETMAVVSGNPVAVESSVPVVTRTDVVKKKRGRRTRKKQKKKLKCVMTNTEAENTPTIAVQVKDGKVEGGTPTIAVRVKDGKVQGGTPTIAVRVKDGKVQGGKANIGSTGVKRPVPRRKKGSTRVRAPAPSRNTDSTGVHIPTANSGDITSSHSYHGDDYLGRSTDLDGDRDRTDDQQVDVPVVTDTRTNEERKLDEFVKSLRLTKKITSLTTKSNLLLVDMVSEDVDNFYQEPAIHLWNNNSIRKRRPFHHEPQAGKMRNLADEDKTVSVDEPAEDLEAVDLGLEVEQLCNEEEDEEGEEDESLDQRDLMKLQIKTHLLTFVTGVDPAQTADNQPSVQGPHASPVLAAKAAPKLLAVHPPVPTPKLAEVDNDDVEMPVLQKEPCIVTPRCLRDNAERVIPCEIDTFHATVTPPPTPPGELPEIQKSAQHDHTKETYKARLSPLNDGLKLTINREKIAMKSDTDSKPVVKQHNLQSLLLQDALQSAKKYKETLHKNRQLSPVKPVINVPKLQQSPKAVATGKVTTELDTKLPVINSQQIIKATDDVKHEQSSFLNHSLSLVMQDRPMDVNTAKSSHSVCSNIVSNLEMFNKPTVCSTSTPKLELFNTQPICTPSVSRSEMVKNLSNCPNSIHRTNVLNKPAAYSSATSRSEALNKSYACTSTAPRPELLNKPVVSATSTSRADMLNPARANDVMAMMQAAYGTSPLPLNSNEAMMAAFQNVRPDDMQRMLNASSTNPASASSSSLVHPMITQQFLMAMTQHFYNMCNTSAKTHMKHDMKTNQKLSENHKTSVNKKPKDISNRKRKYSEVDANGALDLSMKKTKCVSSNSPVCTRASNDDTPLDFSKRPNIESMYNYANPMVSAGNLSLSNASQLYYAGQAAPDISKYYKHTSRSSTVSASAYKNTRPHIPDSKQLNLNSVTSNRLECHTEDKVKSGVGRYTELPDRRHSGSKITKETCRCASRDDISKWSVEQVCSFLTTLEGCAAYARTFYDQGISGRLLPYLTTQHLTRTLGMKVGPALILMQAVERKFREAMMVPACKLCKSSAAIPVQQM